MALGRVVELGCGIPAGLPRSAGRGRSHALTFHLCHVLLNTPTKPPGGPTGLGPGLLAWGRVLQVDRLARGSLSPSSGGYMAHEFSNLRRDADHVAYHDDRGRTDPLLCDKTFHLIQC